MLTLFDELYLLALNEEKGNLIQSTRATFAFAYAGGVLDELALRGKVHLNTKSRLEVVDTGKMDDKVLDEALKEIQASEKQRKLTYWVSRFAEQPKKIREREGERLAAQNVLVREENRFFRSASGTPGIASKYEMKHQLRGMILLGETVKPSFLALLTLLDASELLHLVFTPDELAVVKKDLHERVLRTALENPVFQNIEEVEQAVVLSIEDESD